MEISAIEALIRVGMPGAEVSVNGDGRHFTALVVSPEFSGKSLIERQRLVMATVSAEIQRGELHALSIKTYSPAEWAALKP
jgi:acid stress-induced BolA-like protein IbaG/YrbA